MGNLLLPRQILLPGKVLGKVGSYKISQPDLALQIGKNLATFLSNNSTLAFLSSLSHIC